MAGNRDSFTIDAGARLAGASDVGLRHRTNQDALQLALAAAPGGGSERAGIVALSDGVSSSKHSDLAATVAATAASRQLAAATAGLPPRADAGAAAAAMVAAFLQAQTEVVKGAGPEPGDSWACTLICALAFDTQVVVGNAGDSRCYWVPDDSSVETLLLSTDDSVVETQVRLGIRREIAENSSSAHAITKWLGPGAPSVIPSVQVHHLTAPGWLAVCSDGLWNYASAPQRFGAMLRTIAPRHASSSDDAHQIATKLIQWARERGGHDNITVALLRTPW
jgi:serine/threonine protein phosphatase PrpC